MLEAVQEYKVVFTLMDEEDFQHIAHFKENTNGHLREPMDYD